MKVSDEIEFKVEVNHIEKRQQNLAQYLDENEEDNLGYPSIYLAIVCNNKAKEANPVISTVKGTRRPGNRAERRKATEHKKNALGHTRKYCTEGVYAYFVKKDANGKKNIRWIADIVKEEAWDEYNSIDWSKVKAVKTRNFGYKHENKHPKLLGKSRQNAKRSCRDYDDFDFNTAFYEYADAVYESEIAPDDYNQVGNPWGYTEEEKREIDTDYLHGDFSDSDTNDIINDRYYEEGNWYDDDYDYYDYDDDGYSDPCEGCMADDTIADLKREIARYKDFLGEFNLNTLYQRWLADNNS